LKVKKQKNSGTFNYQYQQQNPIFDLQDYLKNTKKEPENYVMRDGKSITLTQDILEQILDALSNPLKVINIDNSGGISIGKR